jgi:hypothetical protein
VEARVVSNTPEVKGATVGVGVVVEEAEELDVVAVEATHTHGQLPLP